MYLSDPCDMREIRALPVVSELCAVKAVSGQRAGDFLEVVVLLLFGVKICIFDPLDVLHGLWGCLTVFIPIHILTPT